MATTIPAAANKFPFLAVAGFESIFNPKIKVTEPMRYNIVSSPMIFYFFFLLNISSIRSVTTKPPTTLSVPKITPRNPKIKAK